LGNSLIVLKKKFSFVSPNEDPLISLPTERKSLGLKPRSSKTLEKFETMLSDLKINQASSSKKNFSNHSLDV
jgi:hypothetical protein